MNNTKFKQKINLLTPTSAALCVAIASSTLVNNSHAAGYIFAGEGNGVDLITHPTGYTGAGGVIDVNICIVPGTANASNMPVSVQNVVNVFNDLIPTSPNLSPANVPFSEFDFESVLLHEVGHCIGASHTNLGVQPGVSGSNTDFTYSTDGINNVFSFDDGPDNGIGSGDDRRGDDINLHWFDKSSNDPFLFSPIVDSSTFSRIRGDLPGTDNYPANGSRGVASILGYSQTEAVMNQGTFNGEAQRELAADDVHGVKLASSGIDEIAGTADDYTVNLNFLGESNSSACDINIAFDVTAGFAFCSVGGVFIAPDHVAITSANIFFDTDAVTWFFNQVPNNPPSSAICNGLPVDVDLNLGQSPTNGPDVILGTPGPDVINALGGNDVVCGGRGDDVILGGLGNDTLFGQNGADILSGGLGDDTLYGSNGNDSLNGLGGDDMLFGGLGNDQISGHDGDDTIYGQGGADVLYGESISPGVNSTGYDTIYGGSADDTIFTGPGGGYVVGGPGNDNIEGSSDVDVLHGNNGLDFIHGRAGDDFIYGGNSRDTLYGGLGDDFIAGHQLPDLIFGQNGNDTLLGGPGNDSINGGTDIDVCNGQDGNDTFTNCETSRNEVPQQQELPAILLPDVVVDETILELIDDCDLSLAECLVQ